MCVGVFLQRPIGYWQQASVFPMCVGVFPSSWYRQACNNRRLPHVRGGVSDAESSPCAWGCSNACAQVFPMCVGVFPDLQSTCAASVAVFPMCVGVFLWWRRSVFRCASLPHVRGGVSNLLGPSCAALVFPMCVGVFPYRINGAYSVFGLPYVWGVFPRPAKQATYLSSLITKGMSGLEQQHSTLKM